MVYDRRQMNRMKQDAIRRSQEMRSRVGDNVPTEIQEEIPMITESETEFKADMFRKSNPKHNPVNPVNVLLNELFSESMDSDKLLTATLMLMLIKEGADLQLVVALGYILL